RSPVNFARDKSPTRYSFRRERREMNAPVAARVAASPRIQAFSGRAAWHLACTSAGSAPPFCTRGDPVVETRSGLLVSGVRDARAEQGTRVALPRTTKSELHAVLF